MCLNLCQKKSNVILLGKRLEAIDKDIEQLNAEQGMIRKQIGIYKEKISRFRMNPIEDFSYD